jgi:asparagine synthetase B (glutamine-hydrolysing)
MFLQAVAGDRKGAAHRLGEAVASISGPFAFVFYDATKSRLFFSRDCLGRRSLLQGCEDDGALKICSLCDGSSSAHFKEVGFDGVYMIDLTRSHDLSASGNQYRIETLPWSSDFSTPAGHIVSHFPPLGLQNPISDIDSQKNPIPPMNMEVPSEQPPPLTLDTPFVQELESKLRQSLALRIDEVPEPPGYIQGQGAKVAVLFSGGLDCTLLARLSHDILPIEEPIDLLNVAFENPRVAAAAASSNQQKLPPSLPISTYEVCPDRITGRSAYNELQEICPGRKWRFIAIDVPYTETLAHRDHVKRLMRPHNTEMDLSIACALYFASRGQGTIHESHVECNPLTNTDANTYTSFARVLLSGLGADELFAGYGRHSVAFSRSGFEGLVSEILLDVSRLGQRNLGRDDRILSHWGRETRFPYLDEDFVAWVLRAPVWVKCGFGLTNMSEGHNTNETIIGIDAEKMALRLVALRLGLRNVAREKKRAIQFGARTAKMEKGRTKGTDALS